MRTLLLAFGCSLAALAQTAGPPRTTFEEHPAVKLANDKLELTILMQGSSFASLVLVGDPAKLSPLWNPGRMARELGRHPPFSSGTGHFVCVDGFGPVSPEEKAAGLPGHGEAHLEQFEVKSFAKDGATQTLSLTTRLPITEENFTRTVRMVDGENIVYVHSELESLLGFDRPAFWAEHATIGSPFLEPGVTVVDMPAARAKTRPYPPDEPGLPHRLASDKEFSWPYAPGVSGDLIDLRSAPVQTNSVDHTACLLDRSRPFEYVTALNPRKRLLIGYVFRSQEYPWEQNWEMYPPSGKMARGMEFSTQPFDVPRRETVEWHSLFGAPVYRWLPAKTTIGTSFLFFYTQAPEGFTRVDDVILENGTLVIVDKRTRKEIRLRASLPL
ncbi:MAG: hypothetical protein ABI165_06505 [Bryobacteraceae bacterium]